MYFFPLAKSTGQETHKTVIYLIMLTQGWNWKIILEFVIYYFIPFWKCICLSFCWCILMIFFKHFKIIEKILKRLKK